MASIIGDGECDIDLTSTAAAHIFVVLDLVAAVEAVAEAAAVDLSLLTADLSLLASFLTLILMIWLLVLFFMFFSLL